MDHLRSALSETVSDTCQELLQFDTALRFEALLGVTVDNSTSLVFTLQGFAGSMTNELAAWTRRSVEETNQVKNNVETNLIQLCWDKIVDVSMIRLEGTLSIVLDNTEVILLQIDKESFKSSKDEVATEESQVVSIQNIPATAVIEEEEQEQEEPEPPTKTEPEDHTEKLELQEQKNPEQEEGKITEQEQSTEQEQEISQVEELDPEQDEEQRMATENETHTTIVTDSGTEVTMVTAAEGTSLDGEDQVVVVVLPQGQDGEYTTVNGETVKLETVNEEQVKELLESGEGIISDGTLTQVTEEVTMVEGQQNDPDWTPAGEQNIPTVQIEMQDGLVEITAEQAKQLADHANVEAAATLSELAEAATLSELGNVRVASELIKHVNMVKTEPNGRFLNIVTDVKYACAICSNQFNNRVSLQRHMETVHNAYDIDGASCKLCNKTFTNRKTLKRHNCINKCPHCDHIATTKILLKSHILRTHETPQPVEEGAPNQPLRCEICQKKFPTWRKLRDHKQSHQIDTLQNISLRILMAMDGQRLKGACACILCDKKFDYSWHLKRHIAIQHKIEGHLDGWNIISQCPVAAGGAIDAMKLRKLFIGSVKSLTSMALAKVAKPCNKTESEYTCRFCKQTRLSRFYVMRHLEQHLIKYRDRPRNASGKYTPKTPRTHACFQCYRKFVTPQTLQAHKEAVHGEKIPGQSTEEKLRCDECGRTFQRFANLERHLALHRFRSTRGEKWKTIRPYQCQRCQKSYASEAKLQNHFQETHSALTEEEETMLGLNKYRNGGRRKSKSVYESVDSEVDPMGNIVIDPALHPLQKRVIKSKVTMARRTGMDITEIFPSADNSMEETEEEIDFPEAEEAIKPEPEVTSPVRKSTRVRKPKKFDLDEEEVNVKVETDKDKPEVTKEVEITKKNEPISKENLETEKLIIVGETSENRCPVCNRTFRRKENLEKHKLIHAKDEQMMEYQCGFPSCKVVFPDEDKLRTHMSQHKKGKHKQSQCICTECGATLSNQAALGRHMTRWHPSKNVESNEENHEETQEEDSPEDVLAACETCGATFKTEANLNKHVEKMHVTSNGMTSPETRKRKATSEKTPRSSKKPTVHMCAHCGMTCSNAANLSRHEVRWHGVEPPPPRKRTRRNQEESIIIVKLEESKEEKQKDALCPICGEQSSNQRTLTNHMKKIHNM